MVIKFPKTPRLSSMNERDFFISDGLRAVVTEKVDGANAAISFISGKLTLQSRGHILAGGFRESQFDLFKSWASEHETIFRKILHGRYVMFGEWCYAKHRVFYDALPQFFLVFDVFDKENDYFISSKKRQEVLADMVQVHEIFSGPFKNINNFEKFIGESNYKSSNLVDNFQRIMSSPIGRHYSKSETDLMNLMEGVYIRIENEEKIVFRMKLHRPGFNKIQIAEEKFLRRPIFPNLLRSLSGLR